jgi:Glycogen debranching enzyme N terminal
MKIERRYPIGAEVVPDGMHFRVWAAARETLKVVLEDRQAVAVKRERCGYFSGLIEAAPGARYRFNQWPDPASRFQPDGPHGPSKVIDPRSFPWTDDGWHGASVEGQVIYEMHIGTFTKEGSWEAARQQLPELAAAGITVLEVGKPQEFISAVKHGFLFQGQEFASSSPFYYFADHKTELSKLIHEGRVKFLSQFRSFAQPEMRGSFADHGNPSTFENRLRVLPRQEKGSATADPHYQEGWLVTNGLGGYASGTVVGSITRRCHGLLIAALPNPRGRMMILNGLSERLRLPDRSVVYTRAEELAGASPESTLPIAEFRLEGSLPVWRCEVRGYSLEKRVIMPHRQNTTYVVYHLLSGGGVLRLGLRPAFHFRLHDAPVSAATVRQYTPTVVNDDFEISSDPEMPTLRMAVTGPATAFTFDRKETSAIQYRTEEIRGYESKGSLWSPGYFRIDLTEGQHAALVASTKRWDTIRALTPDGAARSEMDRRRRLISIAHPSARSGPAAKLVRGCIAQAWSVAEVLRCWIKTAGGAEG